MCSIMGEKDKWTEVSEPVANESTSHNQKKEDDPHENKEETTTIPVHKDEYVPQNKVEEKDVLEEKAMAEEMEEDGKDDEKVETQKMDADPEGKEMGKENGAKEEEEEREGGVSGTMEEEVEQKEIEESKEEVDELKAVEERAENSKQKKDSKKSGKGKATGTKKKKHKESWDEEKKERKESKGKEDESKEETESVAMEEEMEVTENGDNKDKVGEKIYGLKEEESPKESKQKKGSKTFGRKETEVEKEQKTPTASASDRPVRQRKSVERLVASIEKESVREVHIEKGRGTVLKDIPNVAYQLSKRKTDDIIKSLHTILFGRRGKVVQFKSNISHFSGFVWNENEQEKQKLKVKEKIDKCVKEKLIEICDVLNIPITKSTTRKEDIVTKLIDFLSSPHATTTNLLAEKEQSSKRNKRKRGGKLSASLSGSTSLKYSAKSRRTEDDSDDDEETANGIPEKSKPEVPESSESDDSEDESEEDTVKDKQDSKKSLVNKALSKCSTEKESSAKEETKKVTTAEKSNPLVIPERFTNVVPENFQSNENSDEFEDDSKEDTVKDKQGSKKLSGKTKIKRVATPKKSSPSTKGTPVKSSSNRSNKVDDDEKNDASPKTFSRKKKTSVKLSSNHSKVDDEIDKGPKTFSRRRKNESMKEKSSTPKKIDFKEKTGENVTKGKEKLKGAELRPSDDELRNAICNILKEVDFNTATFKDILKQLTGLFKTDLTARKSLMKLIIHDELTKINDEVNDEEEEEDEGYAEKDYPKSSGKGGRGVTAVGGT